MTTNAKRHTPTIAALLLAAAFASGCGSDSTGGTAPTQPPPSSSGPAVSPPHDFVMARQVTVVRSGGLRGERTTYVFTLHRSPPTGFTTDQVRAILRAAADPALKSLGATKPGNPCCDQYLYRLTVTLPDGTARSYSAVQGSHQPAPLAQLLDLVA